MTSAGKDLPKSAENFRSGTPAEQTLINGASVAMLPDREELGRLIYLAVYEPQGAVWAANESKDVWFAAADRLRAALGTTP